MAVAVTSGWLAALALAIVWCRGLRQLRARVNMGIHEMRRPLQHAFLLAPERALNRNLADALERTLAALDDLDARANNRRQAAQRRPVDVRQLVEGCLALRQEVSPSERPCLRWNATTSRVMGDPDRLRQVFDNLIENATTHGAPPIWISADEGPRALRVAVGNAAADTHGSDRRLISESGHGYGLGIVRDLVDEHGGRLECRRRSAGYEAIVELPLCRV